MAKGTITFEFESLPDLQRQMWAALGPMSLMADAAAKDLCPQPVQTNATRTFPAGTVYYSDGREPTHIPTTQATPFEPTKAQVDEAGEIAKETADAIRTASGIDAAGRQADKEAAAATQAAEPVKEALKDMVGATPTPEQNTPAITLETLANAPYPELLAFCKSNPGVGLDVSKCQHEYFRKYVETKVKTYLETK
jgi:hypothetical protein